MLALAKGRAKKTSIVLVGLISLDVNALDALVETEESLRKVSKY